MFNTQTITITWCCNNVVVHFVSSWSDRVHSYCWLLTIWLWCRLRYFREKTKWVWIKLSDLFISQRRLDNWSNTLLKSSRRSFNGSYSIICICPEWRIPAILACEHTPRKPYLYREYIRLDFEKSVKHSECVCVCVCCTHRYALYQFCDFVVSITIET